MLNFVKPCGLWRQFSMHIQRTMTIETMLTGRKKKLKCDNDYRKSGTFHNFSTCLTLHTGFACGIITYFVVVAVVVVLFIVDAKAVAVAVIAATVLVLRYLFDSPAIVGSTQATAPTMHSTLLHVGCKYCHLSRANTK